MGKYKGELCEKKVCVELGVLKKQIFFIFIAVELYEMEWKVFYILILCFKYYQTGKCLRDRWRGKLFLIWTILQVHFLVWKYYTWARQGAMMIDCLLLFYQCSFYTSMKLPSRRMSRSIYQIRPLYNRRICTTLLDMLILPRRINEKHHLSLIQN